MNSTQEQEFVKFARDESMRDDCFLCRPSAQLLAHTSEWGFTMAGLGPLCDGYALVATFGHGAIENRHSPIALEKLAEYAENVQQALADEFGSCMLAEHGKMPVCNPNRPVGSHCFHPHFLLFPGVPDPMQEFNDYFGFPGDHFGSLKEALAHAVHLPNYLLGSSRTGEYVVFPTANGLPRQFARAIVADIQGRGELASWQTYPNGEWGRS